MILIKFFIISPTTYNGGFDHPELQMFLNTHKIISIVINFFMDHDGPRWAITVKYDISRTSATNSKYSTTMSRQLIATKSTICDVPITEYNVADVSNTAQEQIVTQQEKKITKAQHQQKLEASLKELSEKERELFHIVRTWRNHLAKQMSISAFIILTNQQVLDIAKNKPSTISQFSMIDGIGAGRSEKFGKKIIQIVQKFLADISPSSNTSSLPQNPTTVFPQTTLSAPATEQTNISNAIPYNNL